MIQLKSHLIITTVGYRNVGKTTALDILADIFYDAGVKDIKLKDSEGPFKYPTLMLYDDPEGITYVEKLKEMGAIVLYVNRKGYKWTVEDEKWVDYCKPDFYVDNFHELRRFEFELRDLVKNLLPLNSKYKSIAVNI